MLVRVCIIFVLTITSWCSAQNRFNILDMAAPLMSMLGMSTDREVCYNELGCFRNDGVFGASTLRPINCFPEPPQMIGTSFSIYSPNHPNHPQTIYAVESSTFKSIIFNASLPTRIITHGYKASIWVHGFRHNSFDVVKDGVMANVDSNVILVHWTRGASGFYFQSVANTRVVASQIALLIKYLITDRQAHPEQFHLIGFSLGAHISGYVGKLVPNLGKITALDTARPYFDGVPAPVRLHSSDALFIELYHTDSDIGAIDSIGDVDIYFNGGNRQPGCDYQIFDATLNDGILDGMFETLSCDHKRALDFYADFLLTSNSACKPIAYRCDSWEQYMSGQCWMCGQSGQNCIVVGLHTQPKLPKTDINNKYYIITNDRQPYCVYQYLVRIAAQTTKSKVDGNLHIKLHSQRNTFNDKSGNLKFTSESMASMVIANDRPLDEIRKIDIYIDYKNRSGNQTNEFYIKSIQLIPLNVINDNEKLINSVMYCTPDQKWLIVKEFAAITLENIHCLN